MMNWLRRLWAYFAAPDPFDWQTEMYTDGTQPLSDEDRAKLLAPATQPIQQPKGKS